MAQPLLLLHGALGSAELMHPLAEELKEEFSVHTLNFPGHGGKGATEAFSIPLFAREVLRYLDEQQLSSVALFGFSMGGYVALYLASQHPERVSQVVTLGTKFSWTPEIAAHEVRTLEVDKIKEKVPQFADMLAKRHQPLPWEQMVKMTRELLLDLGEHPPLNKERLKKLSQPVVIALGEYDTMVSLEESREAAANIEKGALKILPATPHPIEKVDAPMLATFLREELIS